MKKRTIALLVVIAGLIFAIGRYWPVASNDIPVLKISDEIQETEGRFIAFVVRDYIYRSEKNGISVAVEAGRAFSIIDTVTDCRFLFMPDYPSGSVLTYEEDRCIPFIDILKDSYKEWEIYDITGSYNNE